MNLDNVYICDIETVGLLPDLTKGQEEDFHILGCSYKSGNEWKVITTNKKEDVFKLFENPDNVIVGHNFWLYDVPALEKIFPDLKIKATIIDTLWLSWYIEPNRIRHGLELYGEEFGVPKPEVTEDQWKGIGMTKEEHSALMKERVSEDVKINTNLWINILNKYRKLYNNDEEVIKSHIKFLMVKAKTYKMFLDNPLKINLTQANKNLGILEGLINEKVEVLRNVMPKVPKKVKRSKPKNIYKKDGTLSKAGERWNRITKGVGLDLEYEGEIEEIVDWLEPNPQSVHQVKDWLFSLGWKPEIFNDSTSVTGEVNKVPQVRDRNKDLCNSVLKLAEKEPAIKELDDLSVIQHRAGIIKGFIRDSDEEGNIVAGVGGLANTLRIKHRTLVNLPSVSAPYGEYIRNLIIPQEGYKFIGSDISGLENQTKLNFIYPYDPEYVKEMMGKYYDSHLDIGQTAGLVTLNESIFYRWYKDFIRGREVSPEDIVYGKENLPNDYQKYFEGIEDKEKEFERIDESRQSSKTVNYCVPVDNTEVLTESGWKKYEELYVGQTILSYKNGELVKTKITEIPYFKKVEVGLLHNNFWKFECTENHRWMVKRASYKNGAIDNRFETLQDCSSLRRSDLILNAAPYNNKSNFLKSDLAVLGWILSDGYLEFSKKKEITSSSYGKKKGVICSISQKKYVELVEKDLINSDLDFKVEDVRDNGVIVYKILPQSVRDLFDRLGLPYKSKHEIDYTDFIFRCGFEGREVLLDRFIKGDGGLKKNYRNGKNLKTKLIYQKEGNINEAIQLCCVLQGIKYTQSINPIETGGNLVVTRLNDRRHTTNQRVKFDKGTRKADVFCCNNVNETFIIRQNGLVTITGNSATYSVGPKTLSETLGCTMSFAKNLLKAYWERNWSVQSFTDDQKEKTIGRETWVLNPINGYWYSLRSQHSKFSTLNQSAGDYIFTLWCYFCMEAGLILQAGFHDEVLVQSKEEDIEKNKKILQESMNKVNKILGLSISIGIDYEVGDTYADVH